MLEYLVNDNVILKNKYKKLDNICLIFIYYLIKLIKEIGS